jgi:hypothetical protein
VETTRKVLMRFSLVLAGLIRVAGFSVAAFAQIPTSNSHWLWQDPKPHGDAILAASFVSASEGWVGQTEGVLHTTDGGSRDCEPFRPCPRLQQRDFEIE